MNEKRLKGYESPTTELIELRVEGVILTVSGQDSIIDDAIVDDWGDL